MRTKEFLQRFKQDPSDSIRLFIRNRQNERFEHARRKLDETVEQEIASTPSSFTSNVAVSISRDDQVEAEAALREIAAKEDEKRSVPFRTGLFISQYLTSTERMNALLAPLDVVAKDYPESICITYLRCLCLAKNDRIDCANRIIQSALVLSRTPETLKKLGPTDATKQTIRLMKTWRFVDSIARDKMSWLGGGDGTGSGYENLPFLHHDEDGQNDTPNVSLILQMAEPLLQGKHEGLYLDACRKAFRATDTLAQKLSVISAIMRTGLRRRPDYHGPYKLARHYFERIRPEWEALFGSAASRTLPSRPPLATARMLRSTLKVAAGLEDSDAVSRLEAALRDLPKSTLAAETASWVCALALMEQNAVGNHQASTQIIANAPRSPETESEVHDYLAWATHAQEYTAANNLVENLPSKILRGKIGLAYANILQRQGRFHDAADMVQKCQAAMLSATYKICPYTSYRAITRAGELAFAAETADIYSLVEQPTDPKGVILVTARGLEQLRRTPIVVLMELKRMGWAVIPLAQGVLPLQKTGIAALDQYLGCITPNREIAFAVRKIFDPVDQVDFQADKGKLFWQGIDLSHALWEEAAANRRQYDIDYTCPALKAYLGNSVKWTQACIEVLQNFHWTNGELNLRTGSLIQFNHRLPDAIFRFYCEKHGDADNFFCLHSANGYQNYFANFSTNVSTKGIMRNMTRHPETRSGSFPVPTDFQAYYEKHEKFAPVILSDAINVTKVKRSTEGQKELPEAANRALDRIMAWRERGGKVACAFGKVVCDSGVPYDGGPAHTNMKEWLNHTIDAVRGSDTLLLIKPHPHEYKEQIACFLNQYFFDLIDTELPDNVILSGHRWFDINDLQQFVDLGLIYNGTTTVELGVLGIPSVLCSHFAPIDYPVGHVTPVDKAEYEAYVRFEKSVDVDPKLQERAACWLQLMASNDVTLDYRYHARQITNKVLYPAWWFKEDIRRYLIKGDAAVTELATRAII